METNSLTKLIVISNNLLKQNKQNTIRLHPLSNFKFELINFRFKLHFWKLFDMMICFFALTWITRQTFFIFISQDKKRKQLQEKHIFWHGTAWKTFKIVSISSVLCVKFACRVDLCQTFVFNHIYFLSGVAILVGGCFSFFINERRRWDM